MRKRLVVLAGAVVALLVGSVGPATAQSMEPAFSSEIISQQGFPEITIRGVEGGFEIPSEVAAGRYHVTLTASDTEFAYVNFVKSPPGLTEAEAKEQFLSAARMDVPVAGWTYGGGTFANPGQSVHFVIDLTAGDWRVAVTRQGEGRDAEEFAHLYPLTVTPADAGVAAPAELPVAVDVQLTKMAFTGLDGAISTGPSVWQFANAGTRAHHIVLWRSPRLVTSEEVAGWFDAIMKGTPPDQIPGMNELTWVGYLALLSPGQTIWEEFDLAPGTYVAICYLADAESGMPHLAMGMSHGFAATAPEMAV